jgi:5-methylcytosine-specific restriction protein A
LDHPSHVAALCANCHREIHYGRHSTAKNVDLSARVVAVEEELGG